MSIPLWRQASGLFAAVVGSGIAAQRLSPNDRGVELLGSAVSTSERPL